MAGVWRVHSYWRKNGCCHFSHQEIFYLYLIPYFGVAHCILSDPCFLDERQKLYQKFQEKSRTLPLIILDGAELFGTYCQISKCSLQ